MFWYKAFLLQGKVWGYPELAFKDLNIPSTNNHLEGMFGHLKLQFGIKNIPTLVILDASHQGLRGWGFIFSEFALLLMAPQK